MRVPRRYLWLCKSKWELAEHLWLDVLQYILLQRDTDASRPPEAWANKSLLLTKYLVIFSYTKRSYNALHVYFWPITRIYLLFSSVSLSSPIKQMLTGFGDGSVGKVLVMQAWGPDFNLQNPCKKNALCGGRDRQLVYDTWKGLCQWETVSQKPRGNT